MRTEANAKEGILGGYVVDHDAAQCTEGRTCSIFYNDFWPTATSEDGSNIGGKAKQASLYDSPGGRTTEDTRFRFETCAICVDTGERLGCATWGFTVKKGAEETQLDIRPTGFNKPSNTFEEALRRFDAFYE